MCARAACSIDTRILNYFSTTSHFRMRLELNSLPLFLSRFQLTITETKEQNSPSPSTSIVMLVLFSGSTAFLPSPSLPEPREDDVFKELILLRFYNNPRSVNFLSQNLLPLLWKPILFVCRLYLSRLRILPILIVNSVMDSTQPFREKC